MIKKYVTYTILLFLLFACVDDFKHDAVDTTITTPEIAGKTTITFKQLFNLHNKAIGKDTIVTGYVASTDQAGNFYKEIFVQNTLGAKNLGSENPRMGMRIRIGLNNTSTKYAKGRKIIINLAGLKKTTTNNVITLGKPSHTYLKDILEFDLDEHLLKTTETGKVTPKTVTISALSAQDLNTFVHIKNIHFKPQDIGKALAGLPTDDFDGQRTLEFCEAFRQDEIILETSNFANFASEMIPNRQLDIQAIYTLNFDGEPVLILNEFKDLIAQGTYQNCNTTTPNVLITEVADPKNASFSRYVELYNHESQEVSLNGWTLERSINGVNKQTVDLTGLTIAAKGFVLIANQEERTETNQNFFDAFSFQADLLSSYINGNGDDAYALKDAKKNRIDVYGVMTEDGTGKIWEYTDGRAYRNINVTAPNSTFNAEEWTVIKDHQIAPEDFSPNQRKANEVKTIAATANLMITEVADPKQEAKARFVEIYNPNSTDISLKNWSLVRYNFTALKNTKALAKLPISLDAFTIPANGFLIVTRDLEVFNTYFGVNADLASFNLDGNGDDAYELIDPFGAVVDVYGNSSVDGTGKSWEYKDGVAIRKASLTSANAIFDPTAWTVDKNTSGGVMDFTPFIR